MGTEVESAGWKVHPSMEFIVTLCAMPRSAGGQPPENFHDAITFLFADTGKGESSASSR